MTTELASVESSASEVDAEALVQLLTAENGLPEAALRKCQQHRELVTPALIRAIEAASAQVRAGGKLQHDAPWIGFYLLWEFQAKEALPAILAAVPGEAGYTIFCDAITEFLPALLATLANDNLPAIDAHIANREFDAYSRSAAARSYVYLVRDGVLTRAEAVNRLRTYLRAEFDKPAGEFASWLLFTLCELYPLEALEDIREAYARGIIDEYIIPPSNVEKAMEGGEAKFQERQAELGPTHLDDTVELLREFPYFQPRQEQPKVGPGRTLDPATSKVSRTDDDYQLANVDARASFPTSSSTVRDESPRIGRNDACPCGSGKKYKKCCLRERPI